MASNVRIANALMASYDQYNSDAGGYSPEQVQGGRYRDLSASGMADPATFLDYITPGGWTAAGIGMGATAGGLLARAGMRLSRNAVSGADVAKGAGRVAATGAGLGYFQDVKDNIVDNYAPPGQHTDSGYTRDLTPREMREQFAPMRYPPQFPQIPLTEQQLQDRFLQTRTGDVRDNRYGVFGGGPLTYDEWLAIQRQYGTDAYKP